MNDVNWSIFAQVEPHPAGERLGTSRSSFSETPMALESYAEGLVRKISDNLHQPALVAAPPMYSLHVWRGEWGQRRVFVPETMSYTYRSTITNCWNILTLKEKEPKLVEEAKQYHLYFIGVSSTKRSGSGTVDLDAGWKLFYFGADPSTSAQVGVGILTSPRLSDCASDWIPLESRICMLKLKVLHRSLSLLPVYAPNATSEYQAAFVDENDALLQVSPTEYTVLMGNFNADVGTDTWKGMIGKQGVTGLNENGRYYCTSVLATDSVS